MPRHPPVRTAIGLAGTVVRLAGPGGTLTEVTLAELAAAGDFERVGVPPPVSLPSASSLDGLPEAVVGEALWWEQHIVEVLRGLPPGVPPSPLDLQAGHGLRGWAFRHRGLSPRELTASASGNSADPR